MAFTLQQVVPWGRTLDEYVRMFSLTEDDLRKTILGCGDGPASFNAEFTTRRDAAGGGGRVVSVDPVYTFTRDELAGRVRETYDTVLEQTRKNRDNFLWNDFSNPDEMGQARMAAMRTFLADYDAGKAAGRYVCAEVPDLPFGNDAFDLALVSHFLFLYEAQLDEAFHLAAVLELLRVAREVRIFPLLNMDAKSSVRVRPLCDELHARGIACREETVAYEFQRGGNRMLRIGAGV